MDQPPPPADAQPQPPPPPPGPAAAPPAPAPASVPTAPADGPVSAASAGPRMGNILNPSPAQPQPSTAGPAGNSPGPTSGPSAPVGASAPPPTSGSPSGATSTGFSRLASLTGNALPPLPPLPSSAAAAVAAGPTAPHRNPMSVASMVSSTSAPSHVPQATPNAPRLSEPLARIPDFIGRRTAAPTASPDHRPPTQSQSPHLPPIGAGSSKPPGAQSPPRPPQPKLEGGKPAPSASPAAGQATGQGSAPAQGGAAGAQPRGAAYPPLPSAFARESPYSPWPIKAGPGQSQTPQAGGGSPPPAPTAQQNGRESSNGATAADSKTFFPGMNAYPRTGATSSSSHPQQQQQQQRPTGGYNPSGYPWPSATSHGHGPNAPPRAEQQPMNDFYRPAYNSSQTPQPRPPTLQKESPASSGSNVKQDRFGPIGAHSTAQAGGRSVSGSGGQGPIPDAFNPRPASQQHHPANGAQPNGQPGSGHKRKRSEVSLPPRPPPTAPFTLAQQRTCDIRPPLLKIDSNPVMASIPTPKEGRAHLGRKVYDPFVEPAQLLDGDLLRNNVGGVLEVAISSHCLFGAQFKCGDPSEYNGEEEALVTSELWELDGLRKRKVWGTDCYTDDSDVLAMALHSGWLRVSPAEKEAQEEKKGPKTILVKLLVGPTLIRYQGTTRQGIRSRSWGNSQDGVSLVVLDVSQLDTLVPPSGRKLSKARSAAHAKLLAGLAPHPQRLLVHLPDPAEPTRIVTAGTEEDKEIAVVDTFVLTPWGGKDGKRGRFVEPQEVPTIEVTDESAGEEEDEVMEG